MADSSEETQKSLEIPKITTTTVSENENEDGTSKESKDVEIPSSDVTRTLTPDDIPMQFNQRRRMSESSTRQTENGSPAPSYYGRGRRSSGARLGSEERVRKISFGLGGVPKSGSWSNLPKDDTSDSDDSLLVVSSRRLSSFVLGPTLMGYNRRQWLNLLVFAIVDFCSAAVVSIQAPFYPAEAVSKGATASIYAAVFFAYEITIFIMFPIFGKLIGNSSSKILYNAGVFITSISLIFFGLLSQVNDLPSFIMLSIIIRVVEGIGSAASTTAKYSIISVEFPQNAAITFASLEKFYFLGCIIAPPLGGVFIQAAGFILPFTAFGFLLFTSGLFTFCIMPSSPELNSNEEMEKSSTGGKIAGLGPILKIPSVVLGFVSILGASSTVGFLNVLLEQHLSKWNYSPPVVAVIFILSSGLYSISASCWAWFREKINNSKYIMLIGSILIFTGFLLIGPAPLLPITKRPWLICIGLFVHGLGLGASIVSGYMLALHDTIENGFADNVITFGLISAIFTSVFSFGQMLGISIAGVLYDAIGFRWGSSFILVFQLTLVLIIIGFILYDQVEKRTASPESFFAELADELDPLLRSQENNSRIENTIHEGQIYNPDYESLYKKYGDLK